MASRGIQGGSVYVPFQGDLSGLKRDTDQAKRIVGDAARDMEKMAKVPIGGQGQTSIARPTQMGGDVASTTRAANISEKARRFESRAVEGAEKDRIYAGGVATYQQGSGAVVRDRAQRDFEKYIAIDRAAKSDRNWNRAIAPREPGMGDIETAARYEAKAGQKLSDAERRKFESQAKGGESSNWLFSSATIAVAAFAHLAKGAIDAGNSLRQASFVFNYAQQRASGIAGRQTAFGIGGDNAAIAAGAEANAAQYGFARVMAHQNAPFAFVHNWMHANELPDAQIRLSEAQNNAQATVAALDVQSAVRVRNASSKGGILRNPLATLGAQQNEELRPLKAALAKFPGNTTIKDALAQLGDTHLNEGVIASNIRGAELNQARAVAGGETLRGMGLAAVFRGSNREAMVAEFAARSLADKAEEKIAVAKAPEDMKGFVRAAYQNRRDNMKLEVGNRLRMLTENAPTGMSVSAAEAGVFPGVRNIDAQVSDLLIKILTVMEKVEANTKGN